MPRRAYTLCLSFAASLVGCAATRPHAPVVANEQPVTRYALQPVLLFGGEGRHSAWHTTTTLTGALEIAGSAVTLRLVSESTSSPVTCSQRFVGHQACAEPGSRPTTHANTRTFVGEARWVAGSLHAELATDQQRLAIACSESPVGYACAISDDETFRPIVGDSPARLVFAAPATRTFALLRTTTTAGTDLGGHISLRPDATAEVTLATSSKTVTLPATLRWAPAGLVVSAGSVMSPVTFSCTPRDAQLACDLSADRGVLGEPEHLSGDVTLALVSP